MLGRSQNQLLLLSFLLTTHSALSHVLAAQNRHVDALHVLEIHEHMIHGRMRHRRLALHGLAPNMFRTPPQTVCQRVCRDRKDLQLPKKNLAYVDSNENSFL